MIQLLNLYFQAEKEFYWFCNFLYLSSNQLKYRDGQLWHMQHHLHLCQSSPKNKRSCLSSVGRSRTSLHYFLLVSPKCTSTPAKQCSLSPASYSVHKADCSYRTNTSNHTQIFQRSWQFFHYAATTLHTHTHTHSQTHTL